MEQGAGGAVQAWTRALSTGAVHRPELRGVCLRSAEGPLPDMRGLRETRARSLSWTPLVTASGPGVRVIPEEIWDPKSSADATWMLRGGQHDTDLEASPDVAVSLPWPAVSGGSGSLSSHDPCRARSPCGAHWRVKRPSH